MDRAAKHFIINASLGDEDSMKGLWAYYSAGNITKEDLEATLRNPRPLWMKQKVHKGMQEK